MIKNIVFDMGRVLVGFDPDAIIQEFTDDPADIPIIRREVFEKSEWRELDRGTLMEEDMIPLVCARLPERLHSIAEKLLLHWREYMEALDDIVPLARQLQENGYALYVLSNAGKSMLNFKYKLPVLKYFTGTLFSAEVYLLKPEPGIYQEFFKRFSLDPAECFFIDDTPENIEAGKEFGMNGFRYTGEIRPLCEALENAGVSVSSN
ncbi:MAG TPA: HAD family phosphatase [Caproiciproducens sp.]|nr:HAD family phosphatase [Caproiciproducens sp.]